MKRDTYRCWDISTSNSLNRGIKVIECLTLDDLRTYLTPDTKCGEASLNDDQSIYNDLRMIVVLNIKG